MKPVSFLTFITVSILCLNAISQGVDCMLATPENAANQLVYQFNPNTGTADIQIPLCEISAGSYHQQVSVSYNTSGILVNQVASCVGLGWELSAEGSISRVVRGLPDDQNDNFGQGWLYVDHDGLIEYLYENNNEELAGITLPQLYTTPNSYFELDTEPDIYYLSLPGISCSFVFSSEGNSTSREVLITPYQNIKITYSLDGYGNIASFIITDSHGNIYHIDVPIISHSTIQTVIPEGREIQLLNQIFPDIHFSVENWMGSQTQPSTRVRRSVNPKFNPSDLIPVFSGNRIDANNTTSITQVTTNIWKVSSIITPLKDTLTFTYIDEQIPLDESFYISCVNYVSSESNDLIAHQIMNGNPYTDYMIDKKISSIESNTGKIEFTYATQVREDLANSKKLNSIDAYSIQTGNYYPIRHFDFNQSYFSCIPSEVYNNSSSAQKRLKLDHIVEKIGEIELPEYSFYYFTNNLPSRFSYAQDIWGYFNGQTDNDSFIPRVFIYPDRTGNDRFRYCQVLDPIEGHGFGDEIILNGANRQPDPDYMTAGILEAVSTPTDQLYQFTYEPHEFTYQYEDDHTVYYGGGLRLKEKTVSNTTETYHYKEFNSQQNSGQLLSLPCFGYFDPDNWPQNRDASFFNEFYVRTTQNLANNLDGTILYNEVYIQGGSEGTTIFRFDNGPALGEEANSSYEWFRPTSIHYSRHNVDYYAEREAMLQGLNFGINEYPFTPHSIYFWARGLPIESLILDANDQKVSRILNEYKVFTPDNNAPDSICGIQIGFLKNKAPGYLYEPLYVYGIYPVFGNISKVLSETKEIIYNPDNEQDSLFTRKMFEYNSTCQISESIIINSTGDLIISKLKYVPDYWNSTQTPSTSDPMTEAMIHFYNKNILDVPIETLQLIKKKGEEEQYITGGSLITYKYYESENMQTPIPMPDGTYELLIGNPINENSFTISSISNLSFIKDSRYNCVSVNDIYSPSGILLQSHTQNGNYYSSVPGYDSAVYIASCSNAFLAEFGYTGFESDETNGWEGFGNVAEIITTNNARSGTRVLSPEYNSGVQYDFDIQEGYESQQGYEASVWAKGSSNAMLKISINGEDNVKTATSTSNDNWNLLTVKLSRIEIEEYQDPIDFIRVSVINTGYSTVLFDDLNFHPSDAGLSISTYDNNYRQISIAGTDHRYLYSEYDDFGRPLRVRDHDGNILSENQVVLTYSQSGQNVLRYTKTTKLKTEVTDPEQIASLNPFEKSEIFQYYDEDGRLGQSVLRKQTSSLKDLISFNVYDCYGHQNKAYLPYMSNYDDGRSSSDPVGEQGLFYASGVPGYVKLTNPYSEVLNDQSPLNRITEKGYPGITWAIGNGHTDKSDFCFNNGNQIMKLRFNMSNQNCYTVSGDMYFDEDSLMCQKSENAEGQVQSQYFDKIGNLVCDMKENNSQLYYTYYIYNDLGQIVYLITPEAFYQMQLSSDYSFGPSDPIVEDYIYSYSYDSRGRLIQKKEPGRSPIYYVYDNLDRIILTQDGNQRALNKWDFASYDINGRVVISGIYSISTQLSQTQMQQSADAFLANSAHRNYEVFICENCTTQFETGYSNESFPFYNINNCQVMAVNYYDSYIWDYNDSYPFNSDLTENSENVYGKLTSQKNRILNLDNPPDWLFTVYYYDQKGRLIETLKDNHLGGREIRLTEPDFDGKPTRSWIYHSLGQNTIREYYTPDYDHSDRLKKLWYSIDNESNSFILYKNKYNSLGMLIERNYHSFDDLVYLQSVDFAYNSRGWLNRINNSNLNNNHHYIDIDQYLGANEAVDGVRLDSLIITLKEIDNELLELDYYDIKEMKIISLDSSSLDRYQSVNEHSLWQIKKGTIDEADFESLRNITDRTFTFLFNNVYFNSSDENQIIIDSLNNMLTQQLVNAGINDQAVIEAFNRQIVSYILGSISFIYFNEDNDDLFGESIYYDATSQATQLPVIPQYDGNISAIKWQTTQNSGERSYCYTYDELNQLQQATYREKENGVWTRNVGRYDVSGITFDKNGNILSLERNGYIGIQGGNPAFGMMDDLSYTYSSNKLKAVEDAISNSGNDNNDFKDNGIHTTVEYEYDNNGNLISDDNKGIVSISYNYLNLPEEIIFSPTRKIAYLYASDGTKLRETITDGQLTHTFDYCGNMVYEDSELSYILNPAGRALPAVQEHEYIYEYFLTDHLGNVRVVYGDPDRDHEAEVIQENSFYPFGMTMSGLNYFAGLENRYLYQGKEATGDFGLWWSDFHARRFDSQLGRWHIPDPAGQFASSYVGMGNNPVIAVDPDGRWAVGGQWYWSEAYKQAQRTVADFQKQLMESFSMEEVEREMQRLEMMDYAKKHGIGQGEGDSDLNTDGTGDGDKPGITNQESQVGEHLIGPILILLGQRLIFLKPFSALGSKAGSSIASLTLSQLLPLRSPFIKQVTTSIFGLESSTAVLGRGLGRLTPGLGWAMTAWDVNYNLIPLAVEKFIILPYWSPSTVKENKINVGHWAEVGVCFRAGTLVSSTNGFVPIEKIKIGDTVLSYNLEKSKIEQKKVENVFKQETQEIYELNTNNQKIFVTAQHPFYVEGKGWVKVQYLQKGDMLKAKDDAQEKLLQIVLLKQKEIVYNIEVEGNHNYFITKSNIMVHNK